MDRETLVALKKLSDAHAEAVRGVLLGAVEEPTPEAAEAAPSLTTRYDLLLRRLGETTTFYPVWYVTEYDDDRHLQHTPHVMLDTVGEGPTPRLGMRFGIRQVEGQDTKPSMIFVEYFDAGTPGMADLTRPQVGFQADAEGHVIAYEYIALEELSTGPPPRRQPDVVGSDPRSPEVRMTLIEQSLDQFASARAASPR